MQQKILDWARGIALSSGVLVNVIQNGDVDLDHSGVAGDLHTQLDSVAGQSEYQWRVIDSRYVIFPRGSAWDSEVSGIHIDGLPRLEATEKYLQSVRTQIPALAALTGPIMKGDPNAPMFTDPVSLQERASVLEHLTQLLGSSRKLVFVVQRDQEQRQMLYFEEVGERH